MKYLEIKEQDVPEYNPNSKNDILKRDGVKGADIINIILGLFGGGFIGLGVICRNVLPMLIIYFALGLWIIYCYAKKFYQKYVERKKIIENGVAYPGIVVDVFDKTQRVSSGNVHSMEITTYGVVVKYADKKMTVKGLDGDVREYLENPYCTVYEWNEKVIASDFKVRDEYITLDGKAYSLKPVKRK